MADDATIQQMQARIDELTTQLKDVRAEAATKRTKNKELVTQIEELTSERDKIKGERDTLTSERATKPTALQARIDELSGKLREVNHKVAAKDKATEMGVKPAAFDALWRLMDVKPESDEVSPEFIAEALSKGKTAHPYLFGDTPGGSPASPPPAPAPVPGQGGSRGGTPPTYTMKATRAQLADPAWCLTNSDAMDTAVKAGTFQQVD